MSQNTLHPDLRVRRTRKLLSDALVSLMDEKEFEAITIREIVERAMVNRATFYRHYEDRYDLVRQCIDDVHAELTHKLTGISTHMKVPNMEEALATGSNMFEHVAEYATFYRVMLGRNEITGLERRTIECFENIIREQLQSAGYSSVQASVPFDLLLHFTATTFLRIVQWWLEHDQPYSVEQMAQWLVQLVSPGAAGALGLTHIDPFPPS